MNTVLTTDALQRRHTLQLECRVITHYGPPGNRSQLHHHGVLYSNLSQQLVKRCDHEHPTIPAALACATDLLAQAILADAPTHE